MKIRFLTTLLTALLTLSVLQAQEFEFTYKGQTLKYTVTAENEVRVEKLDDNLSGDVIIPSEVKLGKKKYKVTSIGHEAFVGCGNIKSVVIPNTVTSIGTEAFAGCNIHVVIPSTVMSIGGGAFYGVKSFRTFDFTYEGETLRYEIIAENEVWVTRRFYGDGCDFSGELKIPSEVEFESKKYKVTRIGEGAFGNCGNLQSVVIPTSVKAIGVAAFSTCSNLQNVVIPNSVKTIGAGAFSSCKNLQSVVIPNSVKSIGADAFRECPNLQGIVIPNSVKTIGTEAFLGCTNLQSISMSESVANIDSFAFVLCPNLSKIEASPNNRRYSSKDGALYSKSGDTLFFVPKKTEAFTIPNTVKCIGDEAFDFCDSLRSIVIPNSVTSIGKSAFARCYNLQSVVIPNSVTSIKWGTFSSCTNLQSVVIPNSVTSIGAFAFAYCRRLQSIVIPNSVTNIGRSAFGDAVLQTFTIEAQTPPIIRDCIFLDIERILPTIYVPAASVEKYKAAEGWWKYYADKIQPIK